MSMKANRQQKDYLDRIEQRLWNRYEYEGKYHKSYRREVLSHEHESIGQNANSSEATPNSNVLMQEAHEIKLQPDREYIWRIRSHISDKQLQENHRIAARARIRY